MVCTHLSVHAYLTWDFYAVEGEHHMKGKRFCFCICSKKKSVPSLHHHDKAHHSNLHFFKTKTIKILQYFFRVSFCIFQVFLTLLATSALSLADMEGNEKLVFDFRFSSLNFTLLLSLLLHKGSCVNLDRVLVKIQ